MSERSTFKDNVLVLSVVGAIILLLSAFINVLVERYFPSLRSEECVVNVDVSNPNNVKITSNCEVTKTFTANEVQPETVNTKGRHKNEPATK